MKEAEMAVVTDLGSPQAASTFQSVVLNHDEAHASGADAFQLRCVIQEMEPDVDPSTVTLDTICDPEGEGWAAKKTTLKLNLRYTPELWGALKVFEMSEVALAILSDYTKAVSATNRENSGKVRVGQIAPETFYRKAENQIIELELPVIGGEFTFTEDPTAAVFAHPNGA